MKPLRMVGREQGTLTVEEYRHVEQEITKAVQPVLVARKIFPTTKIGDAGYMQTKYYTQTQMSQAQISMYGETESEDKVVRYPTVLPVPIIHKDFLLHWRDILASRRFGESIDVSHGQDAARQVAEEEDKLLLTGEYTGWEAYGIQGLATRANRGTTPGGAWPANAIANINAARAVLQAAGYVGVPFTLVGRVTQIKALDGQVANTAFTYRQFLLQNKLVQAIYESDNLFTAAGLTTSALLVATAKENFDLVIAQDITTFMWQDKHMNQHGKVYEAVVPRIRRPTSICEITGLSVA